MFNFTRPNRRNVFLVLALACTSLIAATMAPQGAQAPPATAATPVYVSMTTSVGTIYLALDAAKAPVTVENFITYAKEGFYNGTIFHRVIKGFMIQGGGFTPDLAQKTTKSGIKNEFTNGLSNGIGTISMARQGGRPDSATSQFFINTADNRMLDEPRDGAAYAVFGKVIKGMDVVDAIAASATGQMKGMGDVPKQTITIEKVELLTGPPAADAPTLRAKPAVAAPTPAADPASTPPTGSTKP